MSKARFAVLLCAALFALVSARCTHAQGDQAGAKPRLIILADMGNEPDEMQQMMHMLMYCNEFDLDGLIAVTGWHLKEGPQPELFHQLVDAYEKVHPKLTQHAAGWPSPAYLRSIVVAGQDKYGSDDVGDGKTSPGSDLIIKALTKDDPRPITVVVNAGSNTLAQALYDYRKGHTHAEVKALLAKLRVHENGAQDNAGAWIAHRFPGIFWIRNNNQTYGYMGNGGPYVWQPYPKTGRGQHQWAEENVMRNHGALGEAYPYRFRAPGTSTLEGGGTTPWLGLITKGLYDIDHPSWGGWSGRFTATMKENIWSKYKQIAPDEKDDVPFYMYDVDKDSWTDPLDGHVYTDTFAPIFRWRKHIQDDFKARMDWCVMPFDKANHNPVATVDGDKTDTILRRMAKAGEVLTFDATASSDPDKGQSLQYSWWIYKEAGTYAGDVTVADADKARCTVKVPTDGGGKQIHVILDVCDNSPISVMHDYRRIVLDVVSGPSTGDGVGRRPGHRMGDVALVKDQ